MIITRSPLRISLGGGGTDLPSYYREHSGFLVSAAIDKYVYITLHQTFEPGLIIKYSKMEKVAALEEVQHPLVREAMRFMGITEPRLEITSMADIPAGTGLGSSGSFTTALLKAFHTLNKSAVHPWELAEQACHIEIERLGEPVGKQDQYIAAYGGVNCFTFNPDDSVEVSPLPVSVETLYDLEDNLLLFFTGYSRNASSILGEQVEKSRAKDRDMKANLDFIKEMGFKSRQALVSGDLREFAAIMNEHWSYKKKRSKAMSNSAIDDLYALAMKSGALGGKLIGAGGGGFLMFYTEEKKQLRQAMVSAGLHELRFRFDFEGTKVVVQ